jgi:hypothetical protein
MKKKLALWSIIIMLGTASVSAQDSGFGAGVMFGQPTGISLKMWMTDATALDAGVAWSFYNNGYFRVHVDFLMHKHQFIEVSEGNLAGYIGVGPKLGFGNDFVIGVRVPLGFDYMFEGAPVDIFLEVAPGLDLTPATKGFVEGGLGVRYFF